MSDNAAATEAKNKGNGFFKKKQFKEAIEAYTTAIGHDGKWAVPYSNRSQCYFYLKQFDKALADGKMCITIDPSYVKGYHRAVNAAIKMNEWENALQLLEKGYSKGFRSNKDLNKLDEMVRERAKQAKDARIAKMPKELKLKEEGNKLFKAGQYEEALTKYQQVLDVCDKDDTKLKISVYCNRALCYQQQSAFSLVIEECNKALEMDPFNAKALMRRSSAFEGMEKYRLALEDVRKVLLRHPSLGVANKAQHRLSSAVRRLKKAKAGQY